MYAGKAVRPLASPPLDVPLRPAYVLPQRLNPGLKGESSVTKKWIVLVLAVLLGVSSFAFGADKGKTTAKKDVVWPAAAIKWEAGPAPGTHVAKLWGDMDKGGPYGVLIKF